MIQLVSAFRNAAPRLRQYFSLVDALLTLTKDVRLLAVWGDSEDDTGKDLARMLVPQDLLAYHHGQPEYGSTEHADRLTALSGLLNAALDRVSTRVADDDTIIWVEGDLFWDPWTLLLLADHLRRPGVDIVAPMTFAGEAHYDTWGMRTPDGRRWGPFWPYGDIKDFTRPDSLVEMGSVGSCVAMTGAVAKTVRVQDGEALVGWCRTATQAKYRVWCAKELRVQHPCELRRRG